MNKYLTKNNLELGQVIPFVVLMMFAIIAMAALIIDGGAIMSNRRTAQAAADAGALAGAQRVCAFKDDAEDFAENYALLNGAVPKPFVDVDYEAKHVTVIATVETNTAFFSRIFGEENLTATARAVAGCYPPGMTDRLLPIAFWWQSSPKFVHDDGSIDQEDLCSIESEDCQFWSYDYDYLIDQLKNTPITEQPLSYIYIVADDIKVCENEDGETICADFDKGDDGGNRVWLDLSPIEGSSINLKKVMQDGMNNEIRLPAWINGKQGVDAAMYQPKIYNDLDEIDEGMKMHLVTVPWYDLYCPRDPENKCEDGKAGSPVYYYLHNKNNQSYRIRGFSTFIITCVTQGQKCSYGNCIPKGEGGNDTNHAQCPGYLDANPDGNDAIEGYFVINPPIIQSTGTSDFFAGDYIISLSE